MGPNGSGKSTLANVLAGREDYEMTKGDIHFLGKSYWRYRQKSVRGRVIFSFSISS